MSEKAVVKKIKDWFYENGGACHKVHGGPMSLGFPDIIACLEGRTWIMDAKDPKARPRVPKVTREKYNPTMQYWMEEGATVLQAKTLFEWQQAGAIALVAKSVEDLKKIYSANRYFKECKEEGR
jgi:hypothetical protein